MKVDYDQTVLRADTSLAVVDANVTVSERELSDSECACIPQIVLYQNLKYNHDGIQTYSAVNSSNQAWDGSYTFKITLVVSYELTSDGTMHMYTASGNYE